MFLKEGDPRVAEIDSGLKNKFRLEETVFVKELGETVRVGDHVGKIDEPGAARCRTCGPSGSIIKYASEGKKAVLKHLNVSKHVANMKAKRNNQQIMVVPNEGVVAVFNEAQKTLSLIDRRAYSFH